MICLVPFLFLGYIIHFTVLTIQPFFDMLLFLILNIVYDILIRHASEQISCLEFGVTASEPGSSVVLVRVGGNSGTISCS